MGSIKQRNEDFYNQAGIVALENRVRNLCDLFNKNEFPFSSMMYGFGKLTINTQDECLARVKELSDLIGFQCKLIEETRGKKVIRRIEY